ncbi:uncharacterized protein [Asterias amurensis]|uniref:uncharacterized protein n=1 Tax=Asterias amurensis TaxID=7602 RepID=UPI003AB59A13
MSANAEEKKFDFDIAFLYQEGSEQAISILTELRKLKKDDGEFFKLGSYDDLPPGHSKVKSRIRLMQSALVICIIDTPDFRRDNWNDFESDISVYEKITSGKEKVIHVQLCETNLVSGVLQHLVPIEGLNKPPKDIVSEIKKAYDRELKLFKESLLYIFIEDVGERPKNLVKVTEIIIKAVVALADHFEIDTKMKELHKKMKEEIDSYKGKWIVEIKKYWTEDPPKQLRNVKEPLDTDQLNDAQSGYLKLASGFLSKPQSAPSSENNILEYGDTDGILQLLKRCRVFEIDPKNIVKLKNIHDIRNELAHHKIVTNAEKDKQWKEESTEKVKDNLYGILGRKKYEDLEECVNKIRDMEIQATIVGQNKQLKKELRIVNDEPSP